MTNWRVIAATALLTLVVSPLPTARVAAGEAGRVDVDVDCHCSDPVGQNFCSTFKQKVKDSAGYHLVDTTKGFGMGVHFSCVDLWQGIDNQLSGNMSAISVAFTIYADNLPGEVYEDSSVFRIGKDAAPEMSRKILAALGQLVSVNSSILNRMRTTGEEPPAPSSRPRP